MTDVLQELVSDAKTSKYSLLQKSISDDGKPFSGNIWYGVTIYLDIFGG